MVTTCWYLGEEQKDLVVKKPAGLDPLSYPYCLDWDHLRSTEISSTRVWPWSTTKEALSSSLEEQLETYSLALDSRVWVLEFSTEIAESLFFRHTL